jgi:anti-sigma-K factor RskA
MADSDPGPPHVDLAGYVLGKLDPRESQLFERHLATCGRCRRELDELREMPALLGQAAAPVELPSGLEARVLAAVAREPARSNEDAQKARVLPARRVRPRWNLTWGLAAAAALVAAFAAGLGLGHGLQGGPSVQVSQTIHLVAPNGGPATGTATIRHEAGGQVIELSVKDLPPPPAGYYYTCWLVADGDTLQHQDRVSVGSFRTSNAGSTTVRWQTAADLSRYPHLGVTLEPDNGNPLHQGQKVLTATS